MTYLISDPPVFVDNPHVITVPHLADIPVIRKVRLHDGAFLIVTLQRCHGTVIVPPVHTGKTKTKDVHQQKRKQGPHGVYQLYSYTAR